LERGNKEFMEEKNVKAPQENKMGTMPIVKLLITMSLPMMISMLVLSLYNIVDSMFVAQISEDALTAVSLAFPLQSLMIAVGAGTGVGINALLSRALGAKQIDRVNKIAENGVFLAILSSVVFCVVGFLATRPFYEVQTNNADIINYGTQYLEIVSVFSFGCFIQMVFERLLQATGKTFLSMITQGTGAIINIILDPIFIFGWFGVPALGVRGAAIATVIGQMVAAILAIILNTKCNKEIHINVKKFRPQGAVIKDIYKVGVPSIFMQAIGSVMTFGMNQILISFTKTATTVFGVYFKIQSFIFMPIFGMNSGVVPVIAYNYGAQKRSRLINAAKFAVIFAVSMMLIGFLVFQFMPERLLDLFKPTQDMLDLGIPAFRIISIHFLLAGFCIIMGTVFQALGKATYSLVVSLARQLVVLLPAAYFLSLTNNVNAVWWAFPIAEIASFVISAVFFIRIYNKIIKKIPDNV